MRSGIEGSQNGCGVGISSEGTGRSGGGSNFELLSRGATPDLLTFARDARLRVSALEAPKILRTLKSV